MKRLAVFVCGIILGNLVAAPGAHAQAPMVRAMLGVGNILGSNWGDSKDVQATLKDSKGRVKGVCFTRSAPTGQFSCTWGAGVLAPGSILLPAVHEPGDTLTIVHEGTTYFSGPFANVTITGLNHATDRVAGRIAPRRANVRVRAFPGHATLTPTGYVARSEIMKQGTAAADGSFMIDLTSAGDLRRHDIVLAAYTRGPFEIGAAAQVPGLVVMKDTHRAYLYGFPGATYRVQLLNARGVRKAETTVKLSESFLSAPSGFPAGAPSAYSFPIDGQIAFKSRSGRPVRIRQNDSIRVLGPSGFRFKIPRLAMGLGTAGVSVGTLANWPLYVNACVFQASPPGYTCYQTFGRANATGYFRFAPPETVTPYSYGVSLVHVGGNEVRTGRTWAP